MEQIRAMLTRRLGGVPVWVWALAIGGGIVGYAYLTRGRDLAPAPESMPIADGDLPADAGDIPGVPSSPGTEVPLTTNPAWLRYVVDRMRIAGEDPTLAHNAATKVLSGLEITAQEKAMWNEIVRRFGPPPEGAPPIVVIPPPAAPPPPLPPPVVPIPPPGVWFTVPAGFVPSNQMGYSHVMNKIMKTHGYPGSTGDVAGRTRIWYHPNNNALRAKYNSDWTKLRTGDRIFIPRP